MVKKRQPGIWPWFHKIKKMVILRDADSTTALVLITLEDKETSPVRVAEHNQTPRPMAKATEG